MCGSPRAGRGRCTSVQNSGGTAFAATTISTSQIKNGAVTASKIKKSAVTASKVKNGAIDSSKIADGTIEVQDLNPSTVNALRMGAIVNSDGTISKTTADGITSQRISTGNYRVDFTTSLTDCVAVASATTSFANAAAYSNVDDGYITILVRDIEFLTYSNTAFHLVVLC